MDTLKIAHEIWKWLSINLILPILLPVFIIFLSSLIVKVEPEWYYFFEILLHKGIWLFVGITMLFDLFQDYNGQTKVVFTPFRLLGITILLLVTVFLFISSLGIIPSDKSISLKENVMANVGCLICSFIVSINIKIKLIKFKLTQSYNYVG